MEETRFENHSLPRNILIAIDASEHSFEAVRYVGRILPAERIRITLLHVLDPVPECFRDLELPPCFQHKVVGHNSWESQQKAIIRDFMARATSLLMDLGHPRESISVLTEEREMGIARDIARKAKAGFDALVVGRRGTSAIRDLILGSIAHKLVTHLTQTTVWVIGVRPDPTKILIGTDSSEGAGRALDYVWDIFGRAHPEILLLHVARELDFLQSGGERAILSASSLELAREGLETAEVAMASFFDECIGRLEQRGADVSRIKTKIVQGVYSRALAIYGEAREEGYGTIVMGRRGLSRVEEFFMGRVSNKVLQMAGEMAVWIVH